MAVPLPTVFVAHGAPTFALDPGLAGDAMTALAHQIGQPTAILVVSAHWDTALPTLGVALKPETIYDFSGFPEPLYSLRYPAIGAVAVAMDTRGLLEHVGFEVKLDVARGLDHGAWIPLRQMYPDAAVPIVPLSMQSHLGPEHHYRLGQALAPLREQGVLVLASGNMTHNLRDFQRLFMQGGEPRAYVREFPNWIWERLEQHDIDALLRYRDQAPGARDAHPADDHLLPLYVALGAAEANYCPERFFDGTYDKVLAMDGYAFWPAGGRSRSQGGSP